MGLRGVAAGEVKALSLDPIDAKTLGQVSVRRVGLIAPAMWPSGIARLVADAFYHSLKKY